MKMTITQRLLDKLVTEINEQHIVCIEDGEDPYTDNFEVRVLSVLQANFLKEYGKENKSKPRTGTTD